jgi:hypothetical protein
LCYIILQTTWKISSKTSSPIIIITTLKSRKWRKKTIDLMTLIQYRAPDVFSEWAATIYRTSWIWWWCERDSSRSNINYYNCCSSELGSNLQVGIGVRSSDWKIIDTHLLDYQKFFLLSFNVRQFPIHLDRRVDDIIFNWWKIITWSFFYNVFLPTSVQTRQYTQRPLCVISHD